MAWRLEGIGFESEGAILIAVGIGFDGPAEWAPFVDPSGLANYHLGVGIDWLAAFLRHELPCPFFRKSDPAQDPPK